MKHLKRGFTLVELLIVMGLLGAIAMIVISAINPIEQTNRARDTRFKADGGQLISAIDRYFAARSEFPWVTVDGTTYSNEDEFGFVGAGSELVGICGADCSANGTLINVDELKPEFRNRDFIKKDAGTDKSKKLWIGKEAGSTQSIYACFIPLAKSTRQKSCTNEQVYTISTTDGTRTAVDSTACADTAANWTDNGWYICIPE